MRALTIRQPWATLVAIGAKRIETRGWPTHYRGWLMIHAGKGQTDDERELRRVYPFGDYLTGRDIPLGAVVAVARLAACGPALGVLKRIDDLGVCPTHERDFGGYLGDDRFGWLLDNLHPLAYPVPAKGAQGLWTPDEELIAAVRDAAREAKTR